MVTNTSELDSTLDLMVDALLSYNEIEFLDLVQFVWRRGWDLSQAIEPSNDDSLRLALKACILERMAEIWSTPPKSTAAKAPDWCESVPSLEDRFSVIKPEQESDWEGEPENVIFAKRNIFAPAQFMYFL